MRLPPPGFAVGPAHAQGPRRNCLTRLGKPTYRQIMDDRFGLQGGLIAVGLLTTVPGCKDPDPDTDTTTGNTTTGDTGGTSTANGTTGDTPTGSGTGSATGSTGDATTGDATTGDSTTGGVETPPACVSYGAKITECYDMGAGAAAASYCADALMHYEAYGPDCVQAFEAWLACLSELSCAELTGPDPVCDAESAAIDAACVP